MTRNGLQEKRRKALEDFLIEEFKEIGRINHSELKSICEKGYRYSYATGRIICKRNNIKVF